MSAKSQEFRLRSRLVGIDVAVKHGIAVLIELRINNTGLRFSRRAFSDVSRDFGSKCEGLSIFVQRHFLRLERASCMCLSFPQTPFSWPKTL
jgi:hypothetical protein